MWTSAKMLWSCCLSLLPHPSLTPAVKFTWLYSKKIWRRKKKYIILCVCVCVFFFQLEFRQISSLNTFTTVKEKHYQRKGEEEQGWAEGAARTHCRPAEADVASCCCHLILLYSQNGGVKTFLSIRRFTTSFPQLFAPFWKQQQQDKSWMLPIPKGSRQVVFPL